MGESDDSRDFKVAKSKPNHVKKKAYQKEKSRRIKEDFLDDKYNKISIESSSQHKRKSRSQLAKEYERKEDRKKPPHPNELYGSAIRRSQALSIDLFICFIIMSGALIYYPEYWIEIELNYFMLETYGQGPLLTYFGSLFLCLYTIIVIFPHIVFGKSFGKAFMGIKVFATGEGYESLNYLRSTLRECLFKPLSLISVVGVLISFLSPTRKMLHDHLSSSIVRRQ